MAAQGPGPGVLREALRAQLATLLPDVQVCNPFAPSAFRWAARVGDAADPSKLLRRWSTRDVGSPGSDRRYRWDLPGPGIRLAELPDQPAFWRPLEADFARRDPVKFAARLLTPAALADTFEYLAELEGSPDHIVDDVATRLLLEASPTLDDDLAEYVLMRDPWRDTFALWLFARRPRTLERHHPLLTALASRYAVAARATAGIVSGRSFPFYGTELTSASAQLATGLLILGVYPSLLPTLVRFVRGEQRRDGGWGDPGQASDVLTTLVATDLLGHLDPDFSPERVVRFLLRHREPDGWWRVYGPESAWLAGELDLLMSELELPFVERFRWPYVVNWNRDRHTGLAGYGHFADLVRFFRDLELLRNEPLEVAYLDLAGFGRWNNDHGMDAGDDVLRLLADSLSEIPAARAIRDGGDEFILIGAPRRSGLEAEIDAMRESWPRRFLARFGATAKPVPPRVLTTTVKASDLGFARYRLSRALGATKERHPTPGPDGVRERLEPMTSG